jgi:hypothetical protein
MIIELQKEFKIWHEMVPWLVKHCGPVLNSKPVVYWQGRAWELSYEQSNCWQVNINDEKMATLFVLRWA